MKILRLELQGFKSFREKTIIQFDQPITAIVGSNGCGKSNVVDALYWVMGDMSPKHLRGSHMTDVIFSGTKNIAAMDMAEVSLVLERNPEKDPVLPPQFQAMNEVQITRRYYRHGESEYFINRTNCRLRDIQEFFMDTGIGAKSYSIIEQGAITRMVAQKPEERRVVLEDVAGITKFKARRAETERKLEQSNLNLQRVDDLVKDLQKQLSSLQKQADKAQKFKDWSDELKDLEVRVATKEWADRRAQLGESRGNSQSTTAQLSDLEAKLAGAKTELANFREEFENLQGELAVLRSQRQEQELGLKEKEGHIQGLELKRETLSKRQDRDAETQQKLESRETELEISLQKLGADVGSTEIEVTQFIQRIEELRAHIEQARSEFESARSEVDQSQQAIHKDDLLMAKITQEIQGDQKQIFQLNDRKAVVEQTQVDIERELVVKTSERAGAERLLEEAFAERKDLEVQKETIDAQIQSYDQEVRLASDDLLKNQENLTRDKLRLNHLQELEKNLEGVGAANRFIARYLKEQNNLAPMIADQVHVPQLLERAVEAAFGNRLETIVVENSTQARELMEFLKSSADTEAKNTRVRFFIAELASHPNIPAPVMEYAAAANEAQGPDNLLAFSAPASIHMSTERYLREHPAVVGRLDELLAKDEAVPAWATSFRDHWVVRDRNSFETLRPSLNDGISTPLTLISLEGDVYNSNGFLDFSPLEENAEETGHLVQRRRELQELQGKLTQRTSDVDSTIARISELKQKLNAEREAYKLLTQRLVALNPGLQKHTDLIRDLEKQVARLAEKREALGLEHETSQKKLSELDLLLNERNTSLLEITERKNQADARLRDDREKLGVIEGAYQGKNSELGKMQEDYSEILQKLSAVKTEQAGLLQEKNLSNARLQQLKMELAENEKFLVELSEQRDQMVAEKARQQSFWEELHTKESDLETEVRERKKTVSDKEELVGTLQVSLQQAFESLKNLEQLTAVNEVEIRNIEARIESQYHLKLSELSAESLEQILAPSDLEENLNPELNREKVERLKGKIDRLGKINMVAMEEYQELAKRYEYLFVQRQDLSDAIKSLFEAIARIDQESKERFREAFESVNAAFQQTFPLMFGGGQAELKLTNPDNLLESGVEIVAQPPGKKLQSVTLLSGGEKALTAVSLIFGIFNIKPSPFAVLDEVDAPLDDTNVARFNQQVRRMCENSQIILITHHKQSMESADALYGVTMEEPGISKLASARLGNI